MSCATNVGNTRGHDLMVVGSEINSGPIDIGPINYDPYDFEIDNDPYPVWRRLREPNLEPVHAVAR